MKTKQEISSQYTAHVNFRESLASELFAELFSSNPFSDLEEIASKAVRGAEALLDALSDAEICNPSADPELLDQEINNGGTQEEVP